MTRILLVEDEQILARSLIVGLQDEHYVVDHARDGEEALWFASAEHHDLVILDLRLPKVDGWEVCRRLRHQGSSVPILMLTACDTTEDVVSGLDAGADDYLAKPFAFTELLARLRALLRRTGSQRSGKLRLADLEMDVKTRRVQRASKAIHLSALEFRVLEFLLRNVNAVQSKARIAAATWDDECGPDSNVLEVVISNLRRKIDRDFEPKLLHTRRGAGYLLTEDGP
ncbi:MAG: DNA-binding response regulator [Planctomycetota bacterium]|nr:MAG: DNA-binding response regulator [Planctomycetota bacterium]